MWKILKSVLSALLGVQKADNAHQDFAQPKLWPYIVTGIVLIVLFVLSLVGIIHIILK